jgi:hypothetical protein
MNIISFMGKRRIIQDFSMRFLRPDGERALIREITHIKYGKALLRIAKSKSVGIEYLEDVVDFLAANEVPESRIRELIDVNVEDLVGLAKDVSILKEYRDNGTIVDVSLVDEWRFE